MSKFKLPKKLRSNNKTLNLFTFDDSVYGHEIKDEWGYSMIDAMTYCKNREMGYSPEECHNAWLQYQEELWASFK